jgi:hypothetical protein
MTAGSNAVDRKTKRAPNTLPRDELHGIEWASQGWGNLIDALRIEEVAANQVISQGQQKFTIDETQGSQINNSGLSIVILDAV